MYVCLFDVDGTLLSSGGAGKAAMENALQEIFGLADVIDGVPYAGRTDRSIGIDLLRVHGIEPTDDNLQKMQEAYLQRLPAFLKNSSGRVLPGIKLLLETLNERDDVAIGLLTGNIRRGAEIKLTHYELWQHFPFGGFGDVHLCRNEVARMAFEESHRHCQTRISADRVWVIGDTPLDVACARAIGAKALAVATGWHKRHELEACHPDLVVSDLTDHSTFLAELR